MARRRHQDPKLKFEKKYKRWVVRYREDILDARGNSHRIRRKMYFNQSQYENVTLAKKALDAILIPINATTYKPRRVHTFAEFATRWVSDVLPLHKISTRNSEQGIITNYLKPELGKMQMADIKTEVLQAWIMRMANGGQIGAKTISNIIACLRTMWQSKHGGNAMNWELVTHDPFKGLRMPTIGEPETYAYTQEESVAIINSFAGQDQLIIWLLAESGMRPGEISALKVSNVDFEEGKLKVEKAVSRNHIHTAKGKGKGKKRQPALSANLLEVLRGHIGDRQGQDLLFTEHGQMVDMGAFRARLDVVLEHLGIRAKVKALGIDNLGFYAFRHFSQTEMAKRKVPLKTRQVRLGHSRVDTALIYEHPIEAEERAFADAMGAVLDPRPQGAIQ